MEATELARENRRLAHTLQCVDGEHQELTQRLEEGIEAVDPRTVEALTRQFAARLRVLDLIRDKPYFARVDFQPDGQGREELYIGKTTVFDSGSQAVVVDWRAPVSSLYYEGRLGSASYTCPDGEIHGEILLKRQLEVENRKLIRYSDIDITFDEELLRPYLEVSSGTRLKNIIATIQAEQNRIIRADMTRPLIVQGVAGSGKTTVALHRVAYLIYACGGKVRPDEFLVLAPNTVFLDYISNVLPELGVENVRQQTFEDLTARLLGRKLTVEDPGAALGRLLEDGADPVGLRASQFLSSMEFCGAVDRYLQDMERQILPEGDFCAGPYPVCSRRELQRMFGEEYAGYSFAGRIEYIKARLLRILDERRNHVMTAIDANRRRKLAQLPDTLSADEFRREKQRIFEEDEALVHDLIHGGKATCRAYLKKIRLPAAAECYAALLSDPQKLRQYAPQADEAICAALARRARDVGRRRVRYEDLAALMHIHYRIHGADPAVTAKHVVIDEAQDLGCFAFFALRETLGARSMTIFGDVAQSIYWYHGTRDWDTVAQQVFHGDCGRATLQKSYRSTMEIMEQANRVLARLPGGGGDTAVPVIRHGQPVETVRCGSREEAAPGMAEHIRSWQEQGMQNIAVICRTSGDCAAWYRLLSPLLPEIRVLGEGSYGGGLSLVPSFLVKGLEFDAALIADVQLYGETETDLRLLYVAMTRAMHCLEIYQTDTAKGGAGESVT